MIAFDPTEASKVCSELDIEEVVRIAYLEPDYLPEAKAIALRELDRRGIPRDRDDLINRVRANIDFTRQATEMMTYDNIAKAHRIEQRIAEVILIGALWIIALIGPITLRSWESLSIDWLRMTLFATWVGVAVYAVWKRRKGKHRLFNLVVIVPAALLLVGLAYRVSK
jgi:hypothetical protein